ncbi:methyl-accepting chemotaxis protein [Clostridium sp. DL1XJH146]
MIILKKSSIGNKLLIFVVIAFIFTIVSIITMNYIEFNNYSSDINEEQAIKGMEALNKDIEVYKAKSLDLVKVISTNSNISAAITDNDIEGLTKIQQYITKDADIDFLTITDKDGIILVNDSEINYDNISNQTNIKRALIGEFYSTLEATNQFDLAAVAAAPIVDEEGNVVGAISIGYTLDDIEILDKLKEIYKTELTIFLDDVRLNTTIIQDGQRLIGTKLDSEISEKVLVEKEIYTGNAEILGVPYLTAYMPLTNTEGESIGVVFAGQDIESAMEASNRIILIIISISVVLLLLISVLLYIVIRKIISNPLNKVVVAANKISEGDLNVVNFDFNIDYDTKDEVAILGNSFKIMSDRINKAITGINSSSEQVSIGANQLSLAGQTLSQGATEQASAIEEITSSVTQLAAQTKDNAVNSNEVNNLAVGLKNKTMLSNEQMKEMIKAMDDINQSSTNIARIIKLIDGIAFQTNILALNAAVEAARAGQYGKGFAVVAEEVKNLASKSAGAAKETAAMIDKSIQKANIGAEKANKTAYDLGIVVEDIIKITQLIEGISIASNEQSVGIEQINKAIDEVAQVVHTNSATAEESAAASEELSGQAELLKQEVAKFKLKDIGI